jgi:hypothetical protein
MKLLTAVAALVSVVVLVAAGGGSPRMDAPLRQRLAAVARRLAVVMIDSRPLRTARVYGPASYRAAMRAWSGGATTSNRRSGRYYVVVIRGRFVGPGGIPPVGRHGPLHYSVASRPWSPTTGNGGISLRNKLPATMSRLGRPALISLR